jgi:transcription elongation GreA/GreB family factor
MKSQIILNEEDEARLRAILTHNSKPPYPDAGKKIILQKVLDVAQISRSETDLNQRVGFYDLITLVSPIDSLDFFKFHIVMPHESDIDQDRLSISTPIATSAIGRRTGDLIQWFTPTGTREMRLIAIRKSDQSISSITQLTPSL